MLLLHALKASKSPIRNNVKERRIAETSLSPPSETLTNEEADKVPMQNNPLRSQYPLPWYLSSILPSHFLHFGNAGISNNNDRKEFKTMWRRVGSRDILIKNRSAPSTSRCAPHILPGPPITRKVGRRRDTVIADPQSQVKPWWPIG